MTFFTGCAAAPAVHQSPSPPTSPPSEEKVTPIIRVEAIEPCLPFWIERLSFKKIVSVPEGDKLGFAILARDGVQVMLQTRASLAKDIPGLAEGEFAPTVIYVDVPSVEDLLSRLKGADIIVPLRKTDYGATEVWARTPCGTVVGFASR